MGAGGCRKIGGELWRTRATATQTITVERAAQAPEAQKRLWRPVPKAALQLVQAAKNLSTIGIAQSPGVADCLPTDPAIFGLRWSMLNGTVGQHFLNPTLQLGLCLSLSQHDLDHADHRESHGNPGSGNARTQSIERFDMSKNVGGQPGGNNKSGNSRGGGAPNDQGGGHHGRGPGQGNAGGWPATTGKPSGKGRSNAAPSK